MRWALCMLDNVEIRLPLAVGAGWGEGIKVIVTAPKPKGLGFKGMPPHPFALFRAQLVGV